MLQKLLRVHNDLRAGLTRHFRAREVVTVLKQIQLRELSETPVDQWAITKSRHAQEIGSVRAGNFDIVDRRSWAFPYVPESLHRLNMPIMKNTPYMTRRFSETPIPRRAINLIKNGILSLKWQVRAGDDYDDTDPDIQKRKKIAEYTLNHPNNTDSWRTLMEAVVEDFLIFGAGTIEPQLTPDYERPFKAWPVDSSTIRIFADWSESQPERPRYAQLTGLKGEHGIITFLDDELIYTKDNNRASTPFGLGKLEVAFNSINALLAAQDMSTKAAADQVHKTWLWWKQGIPPSQQETVRRHIQNEAEGQAKISMIAGMPEPTVVDVTPVKAEDLLLVWQEFVIRIIASGFDLSALSLGLERDINRNTAEVLSEMDFASAVVPVAKKFEEAITRLVLHRLLGWKDLEFEFLGLDDPNPLVHLEIMSGLYRNNALTPDEMRDQFQVGPPIEGGWGRLTLGQQQMILFSALGKAPRVPMGSGGSSLMPSVPGGGLGGGGGTIAGASLHTSPFQAEDVARMSPEVVNAYQNTGLLPQSNPQLMQEMEEQKPGILETVSKELMEYFEYVEDEEKDDANKPAKITTADVNEQKQKYRQWQHKTTPEEAARQRNPPMVTRDPYRGQVRIGRSLPKKPTKK